MENLEQELSSLAITPRGASASSMSSGLVQSSFITIQQEDVSPTRQQKYLAKRIHRAHEVFVSTYSYVFCRDLLSSESQLIILGAPGSGKTAMSLMLLRQYRKQYHINFVESIDDFNIVNDVDTDKSNILVFDDMFGKCGLCDSEKWSRVLGQLDSMFDEYRFSPSDKRKTRRPEAIETDAKPDLKVIFTSRSNIYKEAQSLLGKYQNTLMKSINVVDLSKRPLDQKEKEKMLSKYKNVRGVSLDDDVKQSIARQTDKTIGFPYMCDMFFRMPEYHKFPIKFFSEPMVYLVNTLKKRLLSKKSPGQASALVLTVLSDGKLNLSDVESESREWKTKWSECLKQYKHFMSKNPVEIKTGANFLVGTFLDISNGVLEFTHPTVYDAVGYIMAKQDINFVFKYCSMKFIQERVKLESKKTGHTNTNEYDYSINVGTNDLNKFIHRLADELKENNFSVALLHEALQKEDIVDAVFAKVDDLGELFHGTDKTTGQCFLFWSTFSSAPYLTEKAFDFENASFEETRLKDHELLEGLLGCAISGNIKALNMIIEKSTSILDHVKSATTAYILQTGSDAAKLRRSLSATSDHRRDSQNILLGKENDSLLHIACIHGHLEIVTRLLQLGCHVNGRGARGRTPLMYASRSGHHQVASALLVAGADLDSVDEKEASASHLAARGGHVDVMKLFLNNGVDINQKGEHGRTPLLYACRNGYPECVQLCLENEGDVTIKWDTDSCLHLACISGSVKTVEKLVKHGMDVDEVGQFGRTPSMYACRHGNIEIVNYLKKEGANMQVVDERGVDCFHLSVMSGNVELAKKMLPSSDTRQSMCDTVNGDSPFIKATELGHYEMLEYFIDNNTELVPLVECFTVACLKGRMPIIEMLEKVVDDVNQTGSKGRTALITACIGGNTETVAFLLSKGANIDHIDEYGNNCWHYACDNGTLDLVRLLLNNGFSVQSPCQNEMSSLMIACRKNRQQLFEFLLEKHKEAIDKLDKFGSTCLHQCCVGKHDCPVLVNRLLDLGVDVNCLDNRERTPAMNACRNGLTDILQCLVERGADLKLTDQNKQTCLHCASLFKNVENIKFLIDREININCMDTNNTTPLMSACFKGDHSVVDVLLQLGADATMTSSYGETCVHVASKGRDVEVLQVLADHGVDMETKGKFGRTPFMYACQNGNMNAVEKLIDLKVNILATDDNGANSLHLSCMGKTDDCCIVRKLIQIGLHVNSRDKNGMTPAMHACSHGHTELFDCLYSKGANIDHTDEYGKNCWHYACDNGTLDLVRLLLNNGFSVQSPCQNEMSSLMIACRKNHQQLFEFVLEKYEEAIDKLDKFGSTCLHQCCVGKHDCPVLVNRLLDLGMDVNCLDDSERTPAMNACRNGLTEILQCLVERGADLKLTDQNKQTCLHCASLFKNVENIKFLIDREININCMDTKNSTPLMSACFKGDHSVVDVLLQLGADATMTSSYGETCVHVASKGRDVEVLQVLADHGVDMETKGKFGRTPFMYACQNGNKNAVEKLIDLKVNILATDDNGANSLHLSCMGKTDDCCVVRKLIQIGLDMNGRDKNGMTPAMHACSHGHTELFDCLYSEGANVTFTDSRMKTCRDFALKRGHSDLAEKVMKLMRS